MAKFSHSVFADVKVAEPLIISKLEEGFKADQCEKKLNVVAGVYRSDEGQTWVLPVVRSVEAQMTIDPLLNHEYLPILGLPEYLEAATELCLGKDSPAIVEKRAGSVQAIGGTGALRLAAEFLRQFYNKQKSSTPVYVSDPTWGNHCGIFRNAGFNDLRKYRYWDQTNLCIDIAGFTEDLRSAPEYSIIIFHACAHNPTGVDPTHQQWMSLAEICKEQNHFPVFDFAYQGFASGDIDLDAWSVRYFVKCGIELLVGQSFSKIFGLYNERIGNLVLVLRDANAVSRSRSQLELIVRTMNSNPPSHGARIVATTLRNSAFRQEWVDNLRTMTSRIREMRQLLHAKLRAAGAPGNWDHVISQIGMFSYGGLTENQVEYLIEKKHIYLPSSGRISMCSLTRSNMDYFVESVYEAITKTANGKL